MKELGTWGTEMEILAFSSLCNTTVYVFCNCGGQGWRWLPYKPLAGNSTNNPCVYLVNKYGHFEPVLMFKKRYTPEPHTLRSVITFTVDIIIFSHKKCWILP